MFMVNSIRNASDLRCHFRLKSNYHLFIELEVIDTRPNDIIQYIIDHETRALEKGIESPLRDALSALINHHYPY